MSSHSPPFISFETRIDDGKLDAFRVPACFLATRFRTTLGMTHTRNTAA